MTPIASSRIPSFLMLFIIYLLDLCLATKLELLSNGFHWTKVSYADRQNSSIRVGNGWKAKKVMKSRIVELFQRVIAIAALALLSSGPTAALAQQAESQVMKTTTSDTKQAPKIPNDQLDSLVAPIALYPDQLLSQTLVASTYPLE